MMKELHRNITNLFGDEGKRWLEDLPQLTDRIARAWHLLGIQPVDNMTYNYVAKAFHEKHGFVVLKLSINEKIIGDEIKALQHFAGHGMVRMIDHDAENHTTLLHQARPGNSLRTLYPEKIGEVIEHYARVVEELAAANQEDEGTFKNIDCTSWLGSLDRADKARFSNNMLEKAISIRDYLLGSTENEYVLHGDLHHDNILADNDSWLAIDPKGIVGEMGFEAAAFDFIHPSELNLPDVNQRYESRVKLLAESLGIQHQRLSCWVYVRLVLGAVWMIEDGGNPNNHMNQAKTLFPDGPPHI